MHLISIIIPTYKEEKNIPVLVKKIDQSIKNKYQYEIIIIDDDSNDGIDRTVEKLCFEDYPVRLKIRKHIKGLSSAVIEGFKMSSGDILLVMDADLSHPPEKIPELAESILLGKADFVIGSRFVEGGSVPHFSTYRKFNARIAKMIARPLVKVQDPLSGFFCFRRVLIDDNYPILNPLGFKIGLELLVKTKPKTILEIPITFNERLYGDSKLCFKEQIQYIIHVILLLKHHYNIQF